MSNTNFIPSSVVITGSLWDRLPYDIIFIILKIFLAQYPWAVKSVVIDQKRFDMFNRMRLVSQLRALVRNTGGIGVLGHFYARHTFVFTTITKNCGWNREFLTTGPLLPPLAARPLLRRIQIHLAIENQYSIGEPGAYMHCTVHCAAALVKLFPAARTLRTLTEAAAGFANLDRLHVHLEMACNSTASALRLFEDAQFVLRARVVVVSVTDREDNSGYQQDPVYRPYLEAVADSIAIEH
jgi:hypothetical protein